MGTFFDKMFSYTRLSKNSCNFCKVKTLFFFYHTLASDVLQITAKLQKRIIQNISVIVHFLNTNGFIAKDVLLLIQIENINAIFKNAIKLFYKCVKNIIKKCAKFNF